MLQYCTERLLATVEGLASQMAKAFSTTWTALEQYLHQSTSKPDVEPKRALDTSNAPLAAN